MKNRIFIIGILIIVISLITDDFLVKLITNSQIESLNPFFIFLENFNIYVIFILFLLILIFKKYYHLIIPFTISLLAASLIVLILKDLLQRPRPYELLTITNLITKSSYSFPSGHVTLTAIPLPFISKDKNLFYSWLILVIIIAFSRLYLGVHYLSDILIGALIGIVTSLVVLKFYKKLNVNKLNI